MGTTNLQLYTLAAVHVNGNILAEEASVTIDRATNSQQVLTVPGGYSGESPGASMTEISVDCAVPSTNWNLNPVQFMGTLQPVEFTIFAGGKKLQFNGFVISDNFSHAVNTESKLTFNARGTFSDWVDSASTGF